MKIGIDGGCLSNRRGFGRFARRLLGALAELPSEHEYCLFLDRPSLDRVEVPARFRTVVVDVDQAPSVAASAEGRRSLRDLFAMSRAVARERLDLIYFPATYSYFPVWNVPRVIVTMHDTLPLAHPELVFPGRGGRLAWWLKERVAAYQASLVLTVSEASRRDLINWFRLEPGRVRVIPEGSEDCFRPIPAGRDSLTVLKRWGVDPVRPYLLYVGGLSPHKNLLRLLSAFADLDRPEVQLILVGDLGDVFHTHVPELRAEVERLALRGRVHFTGFVPDEDLAYLYSGAIALVQPSILEGFGLPPLEAMSCGTPVVCSRTGSLPEVVGEAGIYFEPTDVVEMAGALRRILDDERTRQGLAARALIRSRRYTWTAAAEELLSIFRGTESGRTIGGTGPYWRRKRDTSRRITKAS